MQAGGGFVKYEQFARQITGTVADIAGEFETLGLAAGHGVDWLAQADISQAHIGQRLERRYHLFVIFEKLQGLVHRHGQNVVNAAPPVTDIQYVGFEALSFAIRTQNEHIGKKLHFHLFETFALAGFAASTGHIKGEVTGTEIAGLRCGGICQQPANRIQGFGVGQRIGPRGAADGPLVDQHDIINMIHSLDGSVFTGTTLLVSQGFFGGFIKNIFRQGRFT